MKNKLDSITNINISTAKGSINLVDITCIDSRLYARIKRGCSIETLNYKRALEIYPEIQDEVTKQITPYRVGRFKQHDGRILNIKNIGISTEGEAVIHRK